MSKVASKLLHISSDEEEDQHSPKIKPSQKKGMDRFQSFKLEQGLFQNCDENDYTIEKANTHIRIVSEREVDNFEQPLRQTNKSTDDAKSDEENTCNQMIQNRHKDITNVLNIDFSDEEDEEMVQDAPVHEPESEGQENDEKQSPVAKSEKIKQVKASHMKDKTKFCVGEIEMNKRLSLHLQRSNSGMNYFLPQFDAFFINGCQHVISCKKRVGACLEYSISSSLTQFGETPQYMGRLKANFSNTIFNIEAFNSTRKTHEVVCTTLFKEESSDTISPKCYQIYLLKEGVQREELGKKQIENLRELYPMNKDKILYLRNRKPQFCPKLNSFLLNFQGRVQRGSVKNFIIEDPETEREVLMFGKSGKDLFSLYVSHPLSPFLALGIVLPQFVAKVMSQS